MNSLPEDELRPVTESESLSAGLSAVARRIARRTTDLIVVGIVLIAGLTFGRQAVEWWRAEPDELSPTPATDSAPGPWNAAPVEIEFGDAPLSLTRLTVAGDQTAAMNRLTAECRKAAEDPAGILLESPAAEVIVSRLSKLTPVERDPTGWSVYRLDDQFSLVAAVRQGKPSEVGADLSPSRLICFGMAVPAAASEWTLFLFRGAEGGSSDAGLHSSDFVPDGFQRLLGLRGQNGEVLAGIAGRGEPADWQASLEAKLRARGWGLRGSWSVVERTCSAQFERPGGNGGGKLSIVMTSDEGGGWTGLIHQAP